MPPGKVKDGRIQGKAGILFGSHKGEWSIWIEGLVTTCII